MLYLVVNTKNYDRASGPALVRFASAASSAATLLRRRRAGVEIILAVPAFSVAILSDRFPKMQIFAQHLDPKSEGSTTGFLVPEIAKMNGATGSLINHSEHRIPEEEIDELVKRLRKLGMRSIVCAKDPAEVKTLARLLPDHIAIEPPELIGSGIAVSKARPEAITDSKRALAEVDPDGRTRLLCGAGIVDSIDVRRAVDLGAEGILVASGVVKAPDWKSKILSLAEGLTSSRRKQAVLPGKV